jgi:putative membrane protein
MWAGPATPARGKKRVIPVLCLAVFTLVWLPLAIAPRNRADWLLENLLTFAAVPVAVASYRKRPLSDAAYVQGTAFMILHTVGSHYTYSEVPAGDWLRDAFGLARNHYDRLVHFAFGLLMLQPLRETVMRQPERLAPLTAAWLSVAQILACSAAYELIEWAVAAWVDPAAGTAYLGTQGDQWDAQKDMACAAVGAVLAALRELVTARGRAVAAHRHLRAGLGPR